MERAVRDESTRTHNLGYQGEVGLGGGVRGNRTERTRAIANACSDPQSSTQLAHSRFAIADLMKDLRISRLIGRQSSKAYVGGAQTFLGFLFPGGSVPVPRRLAFRREARSDTPQRVPCWGDCRVRSGLLLLPFRRT